MNTDFSSLIEAIETELKGLGYTIAKSPQDESASLNKEKLAWIENPEGAHLEDYGQHYYDTEAISVIIMESKSGIQNQNDIIKVHIS